MRNEGGCARAPKNPAAARTHTKHPAGWLPALITLQKRRCEGGDYGAKRNATCVAREAWLTVQLPEFPRKDIIWHESLNPMVLNVDKGVLYIIGFPPHPLEFKAYGATNPPYFGFVWNGIGWKRIGFSEIPASIYDGNMLIESIPNNRTNFLRLPMKNSDRENGSCRYPHYVRRVDPTFTMGAYLSVLE